VKPLTPRQQEVFDFIKSFIEENSYAPAVRDIAKAFDITAKAAHDHMKALERKGVIHSSEGISRSTGIVGYAAAQKVETITIPVLGATAAGLPILAEENREYELEIPASLIPASGPYCALHVEGDSMIDAGIHNNDMILVKKQEVAYDKDIVVALIDNETTVKTFYRERDRVRLQPENINYEPIYVYKDLQILGKVFGVFRIFN